MSNPYSPPKAPLDERPSSPYQSAEYRRMKSANRPLGVVLVVSLFFAFSFASAAALMVEGEQWWVVHIAITALLAYWFRNLWWGEDKERKIAVFLGFFVAAISVFGAPEGDIGNWPLKEHVNAAEGLYFLLSACYLIYAKKNPFFASQPAP